MSKVHITIRDFRETYTTYTIECDAHTEYIRKELKKLLDKDSIGRLYKEGDKNIFEIYSDDHIGIWDTYMEELMKSNSFKLFSLNWARNNWWFI